VKRVFLKGDPVKYHQRSSENVKYQSLTARASETLPVIKGSENEKIN
jgi:hypothetical protein